MTCAATASPIANGIRQVRDVLRRAGADQDVLQIMYATVDEAVAAAPAERDSGQ